MGDLFIYQIEVDKACFQHGMVTGDFTICLKDFSAKVLHDKAFNFSKNPKYDGYQ